MKATARSNQRNHNGWALSGKCAVGTGLTAAALLSTLIPQSAQAAATAETAVSIHAAVGQRALPATSVHPDTRFGSRRGWVSTPFASGSALAYAVTTQDDGKVLAAGQVFDSQWHSQVAVVRYHRNGGLDRSFGDNGRFVSSLPNSQSPFVATSIAIQPRTGKIVLGGGYGLGELLTMRLTTTGRLDHSFGPARRGYAAVNVGGFSNAMALTPTGAIMIGGFDGNLLGKPMAVARLTRNGHLDHQFGNHGIVRAMFWTPSAASSAGVQGMVVAANGDTTVMGHVDYIGNGGHGSAAVFRLTPTGKFRRSFGTAGHTEVAFPKPGGSAQFWFPCAMVTDTRGRLTVTGDGTQGPAAKPGVGLLTARLTRSGKLDKSYGSQRSGRSVIAGATDGQGTTCGAIATGSGGTIVGIENQVIALTSHGRRDRGFAPSGVLTVAKPANVLLNGMATAGPSTFLTTGSAGNNLYVGRYRIDNLCARSISTAPSPRGC